MINYRNFKRLLGETSLERKCRFLFGVALLLLISGSFWLDAARTRQLVERQQVAAARRLVPQLLFHRHIQRKLEQEAALVDAAAQAAVAARDVATTEGPALDEPHRSPPNDSADDQNLTPDTKPPVERIAAFEDQVARATEATTIDSAAGVQWNLTLDSEEYPYEDQGFEAIAQFRKPVETGESAEGTADLHQFDYDEDGERVLRYYAGIHAMQSCVNCHNGVRAAKYDDGQYVAMAGVTLSMANVEWQLSRNRAILLAAAIITTFLAMLAAYAIVRYIIVKPVLHLKDVSDEIALGNLNLRAEITTGDEFEELSHAFNRMLRHMTTVNDELRGLNDSLDAKVDQLAQANMELFNSNKLKDDFLATISHELRTPLNSILGFSDILAGASNLNEKQQRYVDNIRTSGRNLMVQINDLLDLAKIEGGQMELQVGTVVVSDLIDALVQQVTPLADQKNIELRVAHPSPALPDLQQDSGKIRQILTNLLSNAIKFTPEGGRVRVSSKVLNDDMVEVCVEDTGIGIPLHEQDNIFEKFRQGSTLPGQRDHVKREFGGTGLGLSIVRELSRLLGGDVHLESEFGKGSLFQLHLPAIAPRNRPGPGAIQESIATRSVDRITSVDLLNQPVAIAESDTRDPASDANSHDSGSLDAHSALPGGGSDL